MYKVAIITNIINAPQGSGKDFGGGSVTCANFISQISQMNDIDLTVIAYADFSNDNNNFKKLILPLDKCGNIEKFLDNAKEYIQSENFDKVYTFNMPILFKNNFLQCHSYIHRCKNTNPLLFPFKFLFSFYKIKFEQKLYKNAKPECGFFAVSEIIKKDYSENFKIPKEYIKVVYPGSVSTASEFVSHEKKQNPVLGIVANNSINKGGHYFLFAAGIAKLLGADFNIKIIAPSFEKDLLFRFITIIFGLQNNIDSFPKFEDMNKFYDMIDYLILPSLNEAFGLVVTEAGALGIPSVVSSTAGVSEILNETNSFIFNRKSFISFVKIILNICKIYKNDFNKYCEYSKNIFELTKKYSWEKFTQEIIEFGNKKDE